MALGALQLNAQEQVAHGADHLGGRRTVAAEFVGPEEEDRWSRIFDRQQRGDDLVPAFTVVELLGQPGTEFDGAHLTVGLAVALDEQFGPVAGEVLAILRAGQEFVDELGALVRLGAVEEGGDFVEKRQPAGEVEIDAALEFGVVAGRGGSYLGCLQLRINLLIDAPSNGLGIARLGASGQGQQPGSQKPCSQEAAAGLAAGNHACAGTLGHRQLRSGWSSCGLVPGA